ncbi:MULTISPECIES: 50S ribosomal protein L28 [Kosmotoga]|uniref:Large ribosomal subunit protein bL28 n=1 Tax=Kosmotoga olearia (strain ATCC BAA-1733 / DSM 21960 / TBF 19.5.1) TaxID=521045 RepID=RL28_KOSOT|nr:MULTISPECIES: 50S ribosomal protein L28 [Kosmotoga]C5CFE0.1 RecName: Full=Large ribosomal subunit protein bL28; AltName: Full=50S ribosomal protein L28 [Kosmotoga olearia TBF 19.5.1]ACR80349.1 ribosomal protein L28 [Kosmotoga olearia TBF 19.5.1]MDI3523784.1 large subunit ribosomal protein [Kosmotoga sp.]MDK2953328.1 large subunit ribosomal protein [Kosmotoga sp.]OAA19971.1 50S ribosomal protein L28 [Kosmotoga sp. DU53]
MSKVCEICGKRPTTGNTVSHSNKKNKRWWKPNVQKVKVIVDGEVKKMRVCTKCLKAGKVQRAV